MNLIEDISKYYIAGLEHHDYCIQNGFDYFKPEMETKHGEEYLNTFITEVLESDFKIINTFKTIYPEEVYLLAVNLLKDIYQNKIPEYEYEEILSMLRTTGGNNPFEASYAEEYNTRDKYLLFERLDTLDSVATLGHESTHYFQDKYSGLENIYHNEILPMLVEMIISYELTDEAIDPKLFYKNMVNRLESIKRLIEKRDVFEIGIKATIGTPLETKNKIAFSFLDDLMYMYTTSFVYAYNLFIRYREDKKTLLNKVNEVFHAACSIDRVIRYYQIDFNNLKTFEEPKEALRLHRK